MRKNKNNDIFWGGEKILKKALLAYDKPVFYDNFSQMIIHTLRKSSTEYLRNIVDVGEGLENRLKSSATKAINIYSLLDWIVSVFGDARKWSRNGLSAD